MNSHEVFIYIHRGCFAGTGAIVRLPRCQWSRPDGYGKISQCITAAGHGGAGAVYMFLGICCIFVSIYIYMCVCVCVWIMVFEWYWLQCYIAISWQMTTLSSAQSYSGTPYNLPILANYAESKLRYKFHLFCCVACITLVKTAIYRKSIKSQYRTRLIGVTNIPQMCRFITEMCTHVHISVAGWYSGIIELVHCGTCPTGILHVLCLVSYAHMGYVP